MDKRTNNAKISSLGKFKLICVVILLLIEFKKFLFRYQLMDN